jgi:hypothetical protein
MTPACLAANYSPALESLLVRDPCAVDLIKVSEFDRPEYLLLPIYDGKDKACSCEW